MFGYIYTDTIKTFVARLAGNWKRFPSFYWSEAPADASDWAIIYTHNRDSDALDFSNANEIERILDGVDGAGCDVSGERHGHWACGWVAGYAVRMRRKGKPTPAARALFEIAQRLDAYPVLNEDDYSARTADEAVES